MKTTSIFKYILVFLSIFLSCNLTHANPNSTNEVQLKRVYYKTKKINFNSINLEYCDDASQIKPTLYIVVCENPQEDNEDNYGRRLFLVKHSEGKSNPLFQSNGALDSFYMKTAFFLDPTNSDWIIILCELGAEYSYGISAFIYNKNLVRHIGFIDAVIDNKNSNPSSALPYIILIRTGDKISLKFTRDILGSLENGKYEKIAKNQIEYSYNGSKFTKKVSNIK